MTRAAEQDRRPMHARNGYAAWTYPEHSATG